VRARLLYLLYPAFVTGIFLAGKLPTRFGYWLSRRGGDLGFVVLRARRRITAENFAQATRTHRGDSRIQTMVRESFRNYAIYLYETLRLGHQTTQQVIDRVTLHDEMYLAQAMEAGKGVIFVSAHLGNMELAAIAMANRIAPMTVAGTELKPREVMQQLIKQRAEKGLNMSVYASAARDVIMALRRNETVGFLVDLGVRWNGKGTVLVDFFGAPAPFPAGLAQLALRTGAPIVPGYAIARADERIDAYIMPPIFLKPSGDRARDAADGMQRVARAMEIFIRENLDQWYMYRPMWEKPPEGARSPSAQNPAGSGDTL
jgi:Kdo2-lipid IVA lauroyltransferase/acyltransferase